MSKDPNFTLRLTIDEEKNKVVIVSCDKDFVDVLFSLMTFPMGTIVKLLKMHQKSEIGCFSNLYKSVEDMGIENFNTEACKHMLLNPRSAEEAKYKRLKLNINPNDDLKYFRCNNFSLCKLCSNFSSSICACRELMNKEIVLLENKSIQNDVDGVFLKGKGISSFIIRDDLKVTVDSTGLVLKTLNLLGYYDVSKLEERVLDVGLHEIVTLLGYMFTSNTPLTNTFLKKPSPHDMMTDETQVLMSRQQFVDVTSKAESEFTLDAIVRKQDMKILYVECGEDFVDLLLTFLAVPLRYSWDINLGCIGNLHRSFKEEYICSTRVLPYYYKCHKQLDDITIEQPPIRYHCSNYNKSRPDYVLSTDYSQSLGSVTLIDPKSHGEDQSKNTSNGFVKRGTRYIVSDNLIITPMSYLKAPICFLKKLHIKSSDLDVQVIKIRKPEAMSLLRASLVTSSALNTALCHLISKKPNGET